jgi:hypothetical protein
MFFCGVTCPVTTSPQPRRLVLLTLVWHHTIAILSFKLNKLFMFLLVPDLVSVGAGGGRCGRLHLSKRTQFCPEVSFDQVKVCLCYDRSVVSEPNALVTCLACNSLEPCNGPFLIIKNEEIDWTMPLTASAHPIRPAFHISCSIAYPSTIQSWLATDGAGGANTTNSATIETKTKKR